MPAYALVPVWLKLSRRFGKKRLWVFALAVSSVGYGGFFLLEQGDLVLLSVLAATIGVGGGCGQIMGPSLQADVIDYDEYRTGERKEGSYFAVWSFVQKSAGALGLMLVGFALQLSDFEPNVEQSELTKRVMLAMFSIFPAVCFGIAALALRRFQLTGEEYTRIRSELDRRLQTE